MGLNNAGNLSMGINNPQRNIIGKRTKLEKVCASNTSLTDTEINRPRKVEVTAIKTNNSAVGAIDEDDRRPRPSVAVLRRGRAG